VNSVAGCERRCILLKIEFYLKILDQIGQSQEALALAAGMDRSYLGGVERGEHNLALVNLIKVSAAMGVPASELLRRAGL
jgi:transcriptional regulator with XRE-family HTH domain